MAAEGAAASRDSLPLGVKQCIWLGPIREDTVLKAGLSAISDALGTTGLTSFPRRPSGATVLTRQGFFERLLTRETLLQNCSNTDVTAAEGDVKHLSLEQLLSIRCQHFEVSKGAATQPKERFLKIVDRAAMGLLAQRLLREEALTEIHRALLMRHVVLIYGANQELQDSAGEGAQASENEWWLLAIGAKRYYLHLPRCEVRTTAPSGAVWCFRSHTAPDPRDPSRSRSFKWQVLLVTKPEEWLEDPLSTEQRTKTRSSMVGKDLKSLAVGEDAWQKATAGASRSGDAKQASSKQDGDMMDLFGDFDVEDLFREFDKQRDDGGTETTASKPSPVGAPKSAIPDDMDDFFDSLLNDPAPTPPPKAKSSPSPAPAAAKAVVAPAPASAPAAKATVSTADTQPSKAQAEERRSPLGAPPAAARPETQSTPKATPTPMPAEPATAAAQATPKEESASRASPQPASATGQGVPEPKAISPTKTADAEKEEVEEEPAPTSADDARLREVLAQFYQDRKSEGKLRNVVVIAQRYAGDRVPELWGQLGLKYGLPPPTAVQWLAKSLGPASAVQWPKDSVPSAAREALSRAEAEPSAAAAVAAEELKRMLGEGGHVDGARALAMRCCLEQEFPQRSLLWQTLLEWPPRVNTASQEDAVPENGGKRSLAPAEADIRERRAAYKELASRMQSEASASSSSSAKAEAKEADNEADRTSVTLEALSSEVDADAKSFQDEALLKTPEVARAVRAIVLTYAWRCSRYIRGTWDVAALLFFVMVSRGGISYADAEADTFWCFSQLMAEVEDIISLDSCLVAQVHRVESLLRAYDPPVADLLAEHGLSALPVLRLGAMLFTRAGFALADCARIWDAMLADPQRFEFADYIIVALLLHSRGKLLELGDVGGLAETLLACPRDIDISALLRTAYSVCAFERRCSPSDPVPFPPRPTEAGYGLGLASAREAREALAPALEAASVQLSSLWGKVRAKGAEAWEAAPAAAVVRESVQQAAATAAAAAGSAATKASAALEDMQTALAARVEEERERRKKEMEEEAQKQKETPAEEAEPPPTGGSPSKPPPAPVESKEGIGKPAGDEAKQAAEEGPPQLVELPGDI